MKSLSPKSIDTILKDAKRIYQEQKTYVRQTGLCPVCKERKVESGTLRCKKCREETNITLEELRKESGFNELILKGEE